jgi:endonuclease/exonuclease/phosphatase family metal-dependent hydrolase
VTFAPAASLPQRDPGGRLIVINWNVYVGNGDVLALLDRISEVEKASGRGRPEFVLLLQESVRQSSAIPASTGFRPPGRIARPESSPDIAALARSLGWWMYYSPSMRNGDGLGALAEDRGNAILSSLPLQSVQSVELPFFTQRRVALTAIVADRDSRPRLRVAAAHFDTRAPFTQGWIFGGPRARKSQAAQLVATLKDSRSDGLPLVIGGDLNTYIGSQAVIDTMTQMTPHTDCGTQPTHALGLTLDHLFADVPTDWRQECARGDDRLGSDHYPLVLSLNVPW